MVRLELGRSNAGVLRVAADLAERTHAKVLAVAACQPLFVTASGAGYVYAEAIEQDQANIEREAHAAHAELRDLLANRATLLDWRCVSTLGDLSDYLCREARGADLILTAPDRGSMVPGGSQVKVADLVLRSGRPVLLVPYTTTKLSLDRVLVAWEDTREARRVTLDALPLLELAGEVTIAEVVAEDEATAAGKRLADVSGWLKAHGVTAQPLVKIAYKSDATAIAEIAQGLHANVIVAGAYGRSRIREWVLGGVTMDLLMSSSRVTLLSH